MDAVQTGRRLLGFPLWDSFFCFEFMGRVLLGLLHRFHIRHEYCYLCLRLPLGLSFPTRESLGGGECLQSGSGRGAGKWRQALLTQLAS